MKMIIGPSFLELNSDDFHFFKSLFSSSRSRDRILEEKNIRFWTHCGWCTQTVPKHLRISIVWPDWKKYPVPLYGNYTFIKWIQCIALHCNDRNVSLDSPKEKTDHIALYFIIINTELTWISSSQPMFQYPYEDYFSCPRDEYFIMNILWVQPPPALHKILWPPLWLFWNAHSLWQYHPRSSNSPFWWWM